RAGGPSEERLPPLANLCPASIGLPKNGVDGRVGEARRITFAVINVTDNVRGQLSAHVITVSELNRQKIARAIECDGHDAESVGIIDTTDVVRRDHSLYLTVAKDISSPQPRTKSARSPILKCAVRSIRLIRYRPAAPQAPRNRIRANADNRKASRPSLFERRSFHHRPDLPLGRRSRLPLPRTGNRLVDQHLPHACFRRTSPQRFRFRGLWQKPGQRFAVCGGNPAFR